MALTAKTLRPPVDVDAGLGAGLGVGGHGRAEALTVPAYVAPARVLHAQIVPECQIIIRLEHITKTMPLLFLGISTVQLFRHSVLLPVSHTCCTQGILRRHSPSL